jgi:hypothetical protein
MLSKKIFFTISLSLLLIACSGTKVVFPKQIEYNTYSQKVVDAFIPFIQSKGYVVLNPTDTRMTTSTPNGFLTVEYLETDWFNSGVYDEATGNEFIIKHKIWVTIDKPGTITVESIFGYMIDGEMKIFSSAPQNLYDVVSIVPESLNNLVSSKSL